MKALVIGGTRFVGLRLVRHLVTQGHQVTILNRGKTRAEVPSTVKRLVADRRDSAQLKQVLQGQSFNAVFDITGYEVRNLEPVVDILSGQTEHYIFISTCGVYLPGDTIPVCENFPRVSGNTTATGAAAYLSNKVLCEDYLINMNRETGFPATILRCPEIYGPENWMHEREFSYFLRVLQERRILVPGDGKQYLHLLHVDDVAQAQINIIGRREVIGQVYNIAGPDAITIDGYLEAIASIIGKAACLVHLAPDVARRASRPVFPFPWERSIYYGIEKARSGFGFRPQFTLKDGLKHTYNWWVDNLGAEKTRLEPGKFGCDVDFSCEDALIRQQSGI